jgi:ribonuclease BN (tRNA processing enzyme)
MKIKILGTRGEIEATMPRHKKQSGILIDGVLLFDLGEKSYVKLAPKAIFITHFHPDHAYFIRRGHEEDPPDIPIYAPEAPGKIQRTVKIGPYRITAIPTHHSKLVASQAYLIKKGRYSILYTGDLVWIDKKYHRLFANVDLVITEASFIREGGFIRRDPKTKALYGHNGVPNLIRLFRPYTENILFTHFGTWFYKDPKAGRAKLAALGKKYGINIFIGHDGKTLQLLPE